MKHLAPITKTPAAAETVLQAFYETKRETVENATNIKYFI